VWEKINKILQSKKHPASLLSHCKWRHYLYDQTITAITDHHSLVHLHKQKDLKGRQARWVELLQEYDVNIEYKKGKSNIIADTLSRRPDLKINSISVATSVIDGINEKIKKDKYFKRIRKILKSKNVNSKDKHFLKFYKINGDTLLYNDRICIPNDKIIKGKIVKEGHDLLISGHMGIEKTYLNVSRNYYWPKMWNEIKKYVQSCDKCQRSKNSTQPVPGLLNSLEIPNRPWESISLDFITHLPLTKNKNDTLITVVDRFSKQLVLIPTTIKITAEETAKKIFDNVVRYHGLPTSIVSDRDPRFTSKFWTKLFEITGSELRMSSSYHPQTDGQTERANQTIEQIIRTTVQKLDSWDDYLPMLEFSYNNSVNPSTKETPFFVNKGYHPNVPLSINYARTTNLPAVEKFKERILRIQKLVKDNIALSQIRQNEYVNKSRRYLQLAENDLVLVKTQFLLPDNIDTKNSMKSIPRWSGPYKIKKVVSDTAYTLDLIETSRVHPTIHISQLKPYILPKSSILRKSPDPPPPPIILNDLIEYEVEEIIKHRKRRNKNEYLVKWKGYDSHENTWEPESNLGNSQDVIKEFHNSEQKGL